MNRLITSHYSLLSMFRWQCYFILIVLALGFFALPQRTQAVSPPPDGGYPGFNTAEGEKALFSRPPARATPQLVGIRSGATPPASSTLPPALGRSYLTTETLPPGRQSEIRRLARRRFYSTPPAEVTQPLERPPF